MPQIEWEAVGALGQLASVSIVLISVVYMAHQLREMKNASIAQSFLGVASIVQSEEIRSARSRVYLLKDKPLADWSESERNDVEKVCQSYDFFAQFCRHGFIPTRFVVASWGPSVRTFWPICKPLVVAIRYERNAPTWNDFEWLHEQSI